MAATGIFAEARDTIAASLTGLGLKAVTDPRNARPLSVLINPPTFTCINNNVGDIRFTLLILAAPPGNQDAEDYLITTADQIMDSSISVIDGRPTLVSVGGQDIPAYELTVGISTRRN